jgi:hypothetical protein
MTAPLFRATGPGSPLYFLEAGPALDNYRIGYAADAGVAPPDTVTLAQTWTLYPGVYLLLGAAPADPARFLADLRALLSTPAMALTRLLVLDDPDAPLNQWRFERLAVRTAGAGHETAALAPFSLRNLALFVAASLPIGLNDTEDGLRIDNRIGQCFFTTDNGQHRLTGIGATVDLPFTGPTAGCFRFTLTVDDASLDALDAGLRFFADAAFPGLLQSLRYPLFELRNARLALDTALDPLHAQLPDRTFFGLSPPGTSSGPGLRSYFRTNLGQPIALVCMRGAGAIADPRFVLDVRRQAHAPQASDPYYLTPLGSFELMATAAPRPPGTSSAPAARMMCGLSGVEYLGLPATTGCLLHFFPGHPAYMPPDEAVTARRQARSNARRTAPRQPLISGRTAPLTEVATTSWAYVTPRAGGAVTYFAQPGDASLFQHDPALFLGYMEVPAGTLPATPTAPDAVMPAAFPLVPYAGIVAQDLVPFQRLENGAISPARRAAVLHLTLPARSARRAPPPFAVAADDQLGTTPQGLLARFDATLRDWKALTLAQTDGGTQQLQWTQVTDELRAALQTNQLFLVLSDAASFFGCASINYELTPLAFARLGTEGMVPETVLAKVRPLEGQRFADQAGYEAALQARLTGVEYLQYRDAFLRFGAFSQLRIRDWTFDLSPYEWAARGTIVVFKFSGESLATLAADPARWTSAADFNRDVDATRERLLTILADAAEQTNPDYTAFNRMVEDPSWSGILFLSVRVPLASLPPQLRGLAAGIDPDAFNAHHVGINVNPLVDDPAALAIQDSSLFGLIAYDSPEPLFFEDRAYDYKVASLKVLFRNSLIQRFASQVMLLVNELFDEPATLVGSLHGNNLLLDGVYQRQGDDDAYVFGGEGDDTFTMTSGVFYNIAVQQTQFVTVNPPAADAAPALVRARFQLWGTLRFKALAGFDALSFGPTLGEDGELLVDGGLRFANLALDLVFDPLTLGDKVFTFNARQLSFDMVHSRARDRSLFHRFPLTLAGLIQSEEGTTPQSLGFAAVDAPLGQTGVKDPWFGLEFLIDLGAPGALAARIDFRAKLLAAWSPSPRGLAFFLGLTLPGMTGGKREITLQGPLKLAIGSFEFTVSRDAEYMLRFNNLVLKLFVLRFPPSGQTVAYLFGNPNRTSTDKALGWYAAYAKPGAKPPPPPATLALPSPPCPR